MTLEEIEKKYNVIDNLDPSEEKRHQLIQLIQKLEAFPPSNIEFKIRYSLLNTIADLGRHMEEGLSSFTWMLQYEEDNPDFLNTYMTLWAYKWVIVSLASNYTFSRPQIEQLLLDMEERYKVRQKSLRPVYVCRSSIYRIMGEKELASQFYSKAQTMTRTFLEDDCEACEINATVELERSLGNYKQAIEQANPILTKKKTCHHVPKSTYAKIILCYMELGNWEKVEEYIEIGLKELVGDYPGYSYSYLIIIRALINIGRMSEAFSLFDKVLPVILNRFGHSNLWSLYCTGTIVFKALQVEPSLDWNLSQSSLDILKEKGVRDFSWSGLESFFDQKAIEHSRCFDERNKTLSYAQDYEHMKALFVERVMP